MYVRIHYIHINIAYIYIYMLRDVYVYIYIYIMYVNMYIYIYIIKFRSSLLSLIHQSCIESYICNLLKWMFRGTPAPPEICRPEDLGRKKSSKSHPLSKLLKENADKISIDFSCPTRTSLDEV